MPSRDGEDPGDRAPPRARVVVSVLAVLATVYVADAVAWSARSDPWIWGDGSLHNVRSIQALLQLVDHGRLEPADLLSQSDYGPLYYLVAAPVLWVLGVGQPSFVLVNALFGVAGLVGVFLIARSLAGPRAGLFAAFALATLPLFRVHSFDGMLDQPGMAMAALALGALLSAEGFRRPGWSLLAGLATGAALLTRWPGAIGLVPVFVAVGLGAALRAPGRQRWWSLGLSASGLVLLIAVFAFVSPPDPRLLAPATLVGALLALGLALLARAPWAPRAPLGLAAAGAGVVGLAGPFYLCARDTVLYSIAVHSIHWVREPGAERGAVGGLAGRLVGLLQALRDWELGGVGFLLLLVGLAVFLWRSSSRRAVLLLVLFALGTWIFVLVTKRPLLERWVFPAVAGLLPIAAAAPFAWSFRRRWVLVLALSLPLACNAWGWWFPIYPALWEPDLVHGEVDLYETDVTARPILPLHGLGWAFLPHPFASLRPYGKVDRWHPTGMWDSEPERPLRVAWLAHPELPATFDASAARQGLSRRLVRMNPRAELAIPEEGEDPWSGDYQAWALVYPRFDSTLELEAARRVELLWRAPIHRRDGVELVLVRSHVVTDPDEAFDPERSTPQTER